MKQFESLWDQLVKKRPLLKNDDSEVTISAANLKSLLQQFYDQGGKSASQFDEVFKAFTQRKQETAK